MKHRPFILMGQDPVKINEMCQSGTFGDGKAGVAIPDGRQGKFCQLGALPALFNRKYFPALESSCYGLSLRTNSTFFNYKLG